MENEKKMGFFFFGGGIGTVSCVLVNVFFFINMGVRVSLGAPRLIP